MQLLSTTHAWAYLALGCLSFVAVTAAPSHDEALYEILQARELAAYQDGFQLGRRSSLLFDDDDDQLSARAQVRLTATCRDGHSNSWSGDSSKVGAGSGGGGPPKKCPHRLANGQVCSRALSW